MFSCSSWLLVFGCWFLVIIVLLFEESSIGKPLLTKNQQPKTNNQELQPNTENHRTHAHNNKINQNLETTGSNDNRSIALLSFRCHNAGAGDKRRFLLRHLPYHSACAHFCDAPTVVLKSGASQSETAPMARHPASYAGSIVCLVLPPCITI